MGQFESFSAKWLVAPSFALSIALAGCSPSSGPSSAQDEADIFSYEKKVDDFAKITTSIAQKSFWLSNSEDNYVSIAIECVKNLTDDSQSKLTIYIDSMNRDNKFDGATKLDALIYKFDDGAPSIWATPTMGELQFSRSVFDLIPRYENPHHNMSLRMVYDAGAPRYGEETVQFYSQYPSIDITIPFSSEGSGKVIADCQKRLPSSPEY